MGLDGSPGGVRYRVPYGANNYLCEVNVEEKALSCIGVDAELDDRKVSIV